MHVGDNDSAQVALPMYLATNDQCPASFLERNCQIDAADLAQWKAAQDRIAVMALLQVDITLKSVMPKLQLTSEYFYLSIVSRSRYAVIDLLQQRDIRIVVSDCFNNPLQSITTIDAANSLVDVIADDSEAHRVLRRLRLSAV